MKKFASGGILLLIFSIGCWLWVNQQQTRLSDRGNAVVKFKEPSNSKNCNVLGVTDGDTIRVNCSGQIQRIRLCGIDSPEIGRGSKPGQPLGQEAKNYLEALINKSDRKVYITEVNLDRYGRTVAEVFAVLEDSERHFLNSDLVLAGLAYDYEQYSSTCPNKEAITAAEALAKSQRLGVWDGKNYTKPWDFRRVQKTSSISG